MSLLNFISDKQGASVVPSQIIKTTQKTEMPPVAPDVPLTSKNIECRHKRLSESQEEERERIAQQIEDDKRADELS